MQGCTVHSLANEVLSLIFECYHSDLPTGTPPVVLSHVCARWRRILLDLTTSWTTLTITHTRRPDVLNALLSRAKHRLLSLSLVLLFSGIELWPGSALADFSDTFKIVRSFIPRIRSLSIHAPNPIMRIILNNVFRDIVLPSLVSLTLVLHDKRRDDREGQLCVFGPLTFDPAVFTHLALDRVMIETPAPCLAGLRSLSLTRTSGSILNHEQLIHPRYPSFIPAPAMPHLTELSIDATQVILPRDVMGGHAEFRPSFGTLHLDTLRLANISMRNFSAIPGPLQKLFSITWGPNIRHVILDTIEENAMTSFIEMLCDPLQPQAATQGGAGGLSYASVTKLTIINVPARLFCISHFILAFPDVGELSLSAVDTMRVWFVLGQPLQVGIGMPWPKVTEIEVDGVMYKRSGPMPPSQAQAAAGMAYR